MKLTVLGASAVQPNPGGACAGYLIDCGGGSILVDCGSGVAAHLQQLTDPSQLGAIIVSHPHPDHFLDLVALRYGFLFAPHRRPPPRIEVHALSSTLEVLERVGRALAPEGGFWDCFELKPFDFSGVLEAAGVQVTFAPSRHYVECAAMRFEADGGAIAYTADTGPSEDVIRLATGADLIVAECTLSTRAGSEDEWGHLAPAEAADLAARAGCGRLILSHYWAADDPAALERSAAGVFRGSVMMAKELESHVVP